MDTILAPCCRAALAAALCLVAGCSRDDGWTLQPVAETWRFTGSREPLDLSGIARANGSHALLVADEAHELQTAIFDAGRHMVEAGPPIGLPLPEDHPAPKKPEADLEAVAWSHRDSCYYAIGSHGVGKKRGDPQVTRHGVFRIPFNQSSGSIEASRIRRTTLAPVLRGIPELQPFIDRPLQQNGLQIEGLAARDGRLWIGLRAPNLDGAAVILEVDPDKLFRGDSSAIVHKVPLGPGRGIRELAALSDGLLILAGNASSEPSKRFPESQAPGPDNHFTLHHWGVGSQRVDQVAVLPAAEGKAEGLLVLADEGSSCRILVLYDGIAAGGPRVFRLVRPRGPGM